MNTNPTTGYIDYNPSVLPHVVAQTSQELPPLEKAQTAVEKMILEMQAEEAAKLARLMNEPKKIGMPRPEIPIGDDGEPDYSLGYKLFEDWRENPDNAVEVAADHAAHLARLANESNDPFAGVPPNDTPPHDFEEDAPAITGIQDETPTQGFSLDNFSIIDELSDMKKQMLDDVFVLDGIALLGQLTTIYAKPNAGKTLTTIFMLKESIKAKRIKGENVYYINADDSGNGLVAKGYIAKEYGFHMLAPGYKGFKSDDFAAHLMRLTNDDNARGKIIILDTLKKFTDLMHKTKGTDFMKTAREFTLKGGTMIMLAHANKNRGADGKIVAGGTSDVGDDGDCVYLLDEVSKTATTKTVLFENAKKRGNNVQELSFSYATSGDNYETLLESVEVLDFETTVKAKKAIVVNAKLEKDAVAIKAIIEGLTLGEHKQADLRKFAMNKDNYGISRRRFDDVLDSYTGEKLSNSTLWRVQVGEKNAKIYYLLKADDTTGDDYENAKNGN